jgi:peptidoglycan/LPS O-acetylase OafA/YrhL
MSSSTGTVLQAAPATAREPAPTMSGGLHSAGSYLPALDGIRGLAALTVVVSHAALFGFLPEILGYGAGQMGVMLFFTLSGFLMTHLYLETASTPQAIARYLIARVARVYPLYAVMVIISYLMFTFVDRTFTYRIFGSQMVLHLLLVGDRYVFWTIPPEIQFYVVFAGIWFLRHRLPDFAARFLLTATAAIVLLSILQYPGPKFAVTSYAQFFLAGVLAGMAFHRFGARFATFLTGFELPLLFALYVFSYPMIYERLTGQQHQLWHEDAFAALMALIVLVAAVGRDRLVPFLASRPMRWLGAVSFSLYLIHSIILDYAWRVHEAWGLNSLLCLAGAAIVLVAICHLSLVAFETPTRRAINAWGSRLIAGRMSDLVTRRQPVEARAIES